MGKAKPIKYRDIAKAIAWSPNKAASLSTIMYRLGRNGPVVTQCIDAMVADGLVAKVKRAVGGKQEQFKLIAALVPDREIQPPAPAPAPRAVRAPAYREVKVGEAIGLDNFDDITVNREQQQAAMLWRARMGNDRWHDDPRALAERLRADHMLPPFYNGVKGREL